jgi:hypothetical protein
MSSFCRDSPAKLSGKYVPNTVSTGLLVFPKTPFHRPYADQAGCQPKLAKSDFGRESR